MEFLTSQELHGSLLKSHDLLLTCLCILVAVLSSCATFLALDNARQQQFLWQKVLWSGIGSMALVNGLWISLYIGLLSLELPYPIEINSTSSQLITLPLTLVFLLIFNLLRTEAQQQGSFFIGSIMLALSIGCLNFLAMKSIEVDALPEYNFNLITLSMLIIIGSVFYAMHLFFKRMDENPVLFSSVTIKAGLVLASGIVLMHYCSMAGYQFIRIEGQPVLDQQGLPDQVVGLLLTVVPLIIFFTILYSRLFVCMMLMKAKITEQCDQLRITNLSFQTHEGIIITDANKRILKVNNAFTGITGYNPEEVIGSDYMQLCSGVHELSFYKRVWKTVDEEQCWSGEYWNLGKENREFPSWHTLTAIRDQSSNITNYVIMFSDITKFKEAEASIHRLAYYDSLTDLPNRRALFDHLARELAMARRYEKSGAVIYFDLDNFKKINDTCGHKIGDELLKQCAARLNKIIRHEDTAARLGGDEFVIVISATDKKYIYASEQAHAVAEKVLESFQQPFIIGTHNFLVTTSIGVALFSSAHPNVDSILKHADSAMTAAKEAGRNTIRFYESPLSTDMDDQIQLESSLRNSVEQNDLLLYFHPYFDQSGRFAGAETLIRWHHPTEGMIAPDIFIPLAEQAGLLPEIGQWVFRNTFTRLREWNNLGIDIPNLSINVSPFQFYQPDFVETVMAEVNNTSVNPQKIILELTEGVLLKNIDDAIKKMQQLKKIGIRFSIDDFGTGYSSLAYLKRLPVSQLKIDKSFIRDVASDKDDATIVKAIVSIAHGMGLGIIAEGIETERQIEFLSHLGDIYLQGHYFSRPLPEKGFLEFVRSSNYISDTFGIPNHD